MCAAILGGYTTGLICVRTDAHTTHSFQSSAVGDGHDDSERRAEETRG